MGSVLRKMITITTLLSAVLLFPGKVFSKDTIRLAVGEWPPYISESLDHKGLISQLTAEAFALEGIDVQLTFFPWQRVFQVSKTGEWDGAFAYAKTAEREEVYLFSEPIYSGRYVFFHLKKNPIKWKKYSDLSKERIAAPRGFGGMGQEFLNAEEKKVIQVDRVNTLLQAFNMMMLGRVKMVPSDMEVGYVLLQQNMDKKILNEITHSEHLIQMTDYHLTLPKAATKSAELIKKFNRGLAALRKSGRYQKIVKEFYQKKIYKDSVPEKFLTVTTH